MNKTDNPQPNLTTSKRAYRDLADYAQQQGVPVDAFIQAGWCEVTQKGRRALKYHTPTGPRWRFLDGREPRHDSPTGYKTSWYGLERALELDSTRLILVNGAAGVIVAQYYGLPAFCNSKGESISTDELLLTQLQQVAAGRDIIIALDCDGTGQLQASKRARQYIDAGLIARAVNLQLGGNGDIADFLKLHGYAGGRSAGQPAGNRARCP